mmetsp:Transcript_40031/g.93976  ORF Transcript_40031/g.93976 Transcript_40031/m.93976 type:complete len:1523 (-) Transcript_40031:210-4778(-)
MGNINDADQKMDQAEVDDAIAPRLSIKSESKKVTQKEAAFDTRTKSATMWAAKMKEMKSKKKKLKYVASAGYLENCTWLQQYYIHLEEGLSCKLCSSIQEYPNLLSFKMHLFNKHGINETENGICKYIDDGIQRTDTERKGFKQQQEKKMTTALLENLIPQNLGRGKFESTADSCIQRIKSEIKGPKHQHEQKISVTPLKTAKLHNQTTERYAPIVANDIYNRNTELKGCFLKEKKKITTTSSTTTLVQNLVVDKSKSMISDNIQRTDVERKECTQQQQTIAISSSKTAIAQNPPAEKSEPSTCNDYQMTDAEKEKCREQKGCIQHQEKKMMSTSLKNTSLMVDTSKLMICDSIQRTDVERKGCKKQLQQQTMANISSTITMSQDPSVNILEPPPCDDFQVTDAEKKGCNQQYKKSTMTSKSKTTKLQKPKMENYKLPVGEGTQKALVGEEEGRCRQQREQEKASMLSQTTTTEKPGIKSELPASDKSQESDAERERCQQQQYQKMVVTTPIKPTLKKPTMEKPLSAFSFLQHIPANHSCLSSLSNAIDAAEKQASFSHPRYSIETYRDVAAHYLRARAAASHTFKMVDLAPDNFIILLASRLACVLSSFAAGLSGGDKIDLLRPRSSLTTSENCISLTLTKIQKYIKKRVGKRRRTSPDKSPFADNNNVIWDYNERAVFLKEGDIAIFTQHNGKKEVILLQDATMGMEWQRENLALPSGTYNFAFSKNSDERRTRAQSKPAVLPLTKQNPTCIMKEKKKKRRGAKSADPRHLFTWICTECGESECHVDPNSPLLLCEGPCNRPYHYPCAGLSFVPPEEEPFICDECQKQDWRCVVCGERGGGDRGEVFKCQRSDCGLFYHESCLGLYDVEVEWEEQEEEEPVVEESAQTVRQNNYKDCAMMEKSISQMNMEQRNTPELNDPHVNVEMLQRLKDSKTKNEDGTLHNPIANGIATIDHEVEKIEMTLAPLSKTANNKQSFAVTDKNVRKLNMKEAAVSGTPEYNHDEHVLLRRPKFICPAHHCATCQADSYAKANPSKYVKKDILYRCLQCPNAYHAACLNPMSKFHELAVLCPEHRDFKLPELDYKYSVEAELVAKNKNKLKKEQRRIRLLQKKTIGCSKVKDGASVTPENSAGKAFLSAPEVKPLMMSILSTKTYLPNTPSTFTQFYLPQNMAKQVHSKPPPYIHIPTLKYDPSNRPKRHEPTGSCRCYPIKNSNEDLCGPGCLNRMMMIECVGKQVEKNGVVNKYKNCACGIDCGNRQIGRRQVAKCRPKREEGKGWGLIAVDGIKMGDLSLEYVGEVISEEEMNSRLNNWHVKRPNDHDFYIMALENNWYIDAKEMGNLSRFINHSCDPNCKLVPKNVNGYIRIGIFALRDIVAGEFLNYDYQFDTKHAESFVCRCGAANCRGTMKGGVTKDKVVEKKTKKQLFAEAKKQLERDLKFLDLIRIDEKNRLNGTGLLVPCADRDSAEFVSNGPNDRYKDDAYAARIFLWRNAVVGSNFYARYMRKVRKWEKTKVHATHSNS